MQKFQPQRGVGQDRRDQMMDWLCRAKSENRSLSGLIGDVADMTDQELENSVAFAERKLGL